MCPLPWPSSPKTPSSSSGLRRSGPPAAPHAAPRGGGRCLQRPPSSRAGRYRAKLPEAARAPATGEGGGEGRGGSPGGRGAPAAPARGESSPAGLPTRQRPSAAPVGAGRGERKRRPRQSLPQGPAPGAKPDRAGTGRDGQGRQAQGRESLRSPTQPRQPLTSALALALAKAHLKPSLGQAPAPHYRPALAPPGEGSLRWLCPDTARLQLQGGLRPHTARHRSGEAQATLLLVPPWLPRPAREEPVHSNKTGT